MCVHEVTGCVGVVALLCYIKCLVKVRGTDGVGQCGEGREASSVCKHDQYEGPDQGEVLAGWRRLTVEKKWYCDEAEVPE